MYLFIPHKVILNAANDMLYVADRENGRIISYATSKGGHGSILSGGERLGGMPYGISFNSSVTDWPMYGVFGGLTDIDEMPMGFKLDAEGNKIGTWGPQEVCLATGFAVKLPFCCTFHDSLMRVTPCCFSVGVLQSARHSGGHCPQCCVCD